MEGLIKGLVDVAIGGNRRDEEENAGEHGRDERSRSTWAQVVSDKNDDDSSEVSHGFNPNQGNRKEQSPPVRSHENVQEGYGGDRSGRHGYQQDQRRKPEQEVDEGYGGDGSSRHGYQQDQRRKPEKEVEAGVDDGWETVGKKPSRKQHKIQKDNWEEYKRPANEQQYSDFDIGASLEPTEEELSGLSEACNKLWELDLNRLVPGKEYRIDCGEGKKVYQREDMVKGSLFEWLSEDVFRKPTYARFCSLLDNYNANEGSKEVVTSQEKQEEAAFIEEISRTAPIKYLYNYLSSKNAISGSYSDFKMLLTSLWFDLYSRGGTSGSSSAFEHVFVGEVKQRGGQQVCGFHNWIQFYLEEAKGRVDYQGYIFPRRRGGDIPDSETQLLTIQFEWNGILKSVSSTLVGVSPEFEIALYSLCFFMGGEDNHVQLGPYEINIKCYRFGNKIGSAFPTAE